MYLSWNQTKVADFSDDIITPLYNQGYLFTRVGKGMMDQTCSLRIDLNKFTLSSENRRVLRKTENIMLKNFSLPYTNYHWSIGKMGKDFYDTKFGDGTFTANKIKELMTEPEKSNFNAILQYVIARSEATRQPPRQGQSGEIATLDASLTRNDNGPIGYAICYQNSEILHYCYPFYQLTTNNKQLKIPNLGLGMMVRAVIYAKKQGKKYIYLGSFQRSTDTYKLQFAGLEWWDGKEWKTNLEKLKKQLSSFVPTQNDSW